MMIVIFIEQATISKCIHAITVNTAAAAALPEGLMHVVEGKAFRKKAQSFFFHISFLEIRPAWVCMVQRLNSIIWW